MQVHDAVRAAPYMASTVESNAWFCMQIHARFACITLYKAAGQKKGFRKTNDRHKKAAGWAATVQG